MNNILELRGTFQHRSRTNASFPRPTIAAGGSVTINNLQERLNELEELYEYWEDKSVIKDTFVSVHYNKIAAKSNRLNILLDDKVNDREPNESIVGAKYNDDNTKHIITHYVSRDAISYSIQLIRSAIKVLKNEFENKINSLELSDTRFLSSIRFEEYSIAKTNFCWTIHDVYYVEKFAIELDSYNLKESSIVSFYEIDDNIQDVLKKIGIDTPRARYLDEYTVLLYDEDIARIKEKAPYLVSMATVDFTKLSPTKTKLTNEDTKITIPSPKNEPTIGVIDTQFDESVYFNEWVEYHNMIDENIEIEPKDKVHGTSVASIIVDGPTINPELDDGCGRFKVRLFGVCKASGFSAFSIIKSIQNIVDSNPDIRVWNLSLGALQEISKNFISPEAYILDKIQYEKDVIFVVAGTNKQDYESVRRIGAPADSLNSLVVNSVDHNDNPVNYSRNGFVLSYYIKPDVSYYGGSNDKPMRVCGSLGERFVQGTSYAAPWVSRKLTYLIQIMGFTTEEAKALIIDSAIDWRPNDDYKKTALIGHGVVPLRIEDILTSKNDEIKFIISGTANNYETYNYRVPVPNENKKNNYIARATLCYFSDCTRTQGVDYLDTEIGIKFGRIDDEGKIKDIKSNKQGTDDSNYYLYEDEARSEFGKWNNVKTVIDDNVTNPQSRKVYENGLWGIKFNMNERLRLRNNRDLKFGVVITLREIYGKNRISEFVHQLSLNGWLVNEVDINQRIDIYQTVHEEIEIE